MNKIQKLSFRNVDEFLDFLPEDELQMVEELRSLIFQSIPEIKEKLSYNVPFYSIKKTMCFIWPASIPWGNVTEKHVVLGFSNGHQMADPFDKLVEGSRKFIRTMAFRNKDEIDPEIIRFYLFEAIELDK